MSSDIIVVMDRGHIIQTNSPLELLKNKNGKFFQLVNNDKKNK